MIVGVLRRYCNPDDSIEDIIADYRYHVAWQNEENPGGAEELNERFIREFDLSLIDAVLPELPKCESKRDRKGFLKGCTYTKRNWRRGMEAAKKHLGGGESDSVANVTAALFRARTMHQD